MRIGRLGAGILFGLLAPGLAGPTVAQVAPRLTGATVVAELEAAGHELSVRAASLPHSGLGTVSERLAGMADTLRKMLGGDAGKPIDTLGAGAKASAYRAHAMAQRTQAFLDASKGCLDADAGAMADALASSVAQLAAVSGPAKLPPVIDGVETVDHRPLFVLRDGGKEMTFALVGANLLDAQCEDPVVTATDAQGKPQGIQPSVTGVSPNRIEVKLGGGQLQSGSYVLHVVPKHKAFLVGCTAQPEAVAVVQVAPPVRVSVGYTLTATCRAGRDADRAMPAITGTLPDFTGGGAVVQQIDVPGCDDPVSYAISAKATFGDGHAVSVGPISQTASAGITTGLPGGLSLSWDPSVRQLFLRPGANGCRGVY
ncbi:hypothetical protein [Rhodanobacter sp. KK11]|uniref:hypothetical protein n=1 Tax=Rhodanobacter sp. KK11 TaxID=3083255 RepID=UPI0029662712|nr:hypothetical protein [Rhodanobacter sp. KK11]MDW2982069.1 hypothetical protein [Rhodanobacter sp. KK11]